MANTLPPGCRLMASASSILAAAKLITAARISSCVILVFDRIEGIITFTAA